jgi:hypothetical protein
MAGGPRPCYTALRPSIPIKLNTLTLVPYGHNVPYPFWRNYPYRTLPYRRKIPMLLPIPILEQQTLLYQYPCGISCPYRTHTRAGVAYTYPYENETPRPYPSWRIYPHRTVPIVKDYPYHTLLVPDEIPILCPDPRSSRIHYYTLTHTGTRRPDCSHVLITCHTHTSQTSRPNTHSLPVYLTTSHNKHFVTKLLTYRLSEHDCHSTAIRQPSTRHSPGSSIEQLFTY